MTPGRRPARLAALVAGVAIVAAAVVVLRQATMTVHHPVPHDSRLVVVVEPETNLEGDAAEDRARALIVSCRAEVTERSELVSLTGDGDQLTLVLEPTLDQPDQRQLRGCLQDLRLPHLQTRVVAMEERDAQPGDTSRREPGR